MKVKVVLISLLVTAVLVGGVGYGAYYSLRGKRMPVEVVPVANINYGNWGGTETTSGNIVSMNSQTVQLNTEYELVKVYVETGDEVKIGDPLLEYDMTLEGLKREMEDLTRQTLELNLQSMEKNLEKLKQTTPTASVSANESGALTSSDEEGLIEDSQEGDPVISEPQVPETSAPETSAPETSAPAPEENTDTEGGGDALIEEEEGPGETGEPGQDSSQEDLILDEEEGGENTGDELADAEAVIEQINAFLVRVNQLSSQELDALIESDIDEALRIYRNELSEVSEEEITDVLGETRIQQTYSLSPAVYSLVGDSTAQVLEEAYDRACVYRLIYCVHQLDAAAGDVSLEELEELTVRALETQIREAVDAYYGIQQSAWANEDYQEILTAYSERLGAYVARLNYIDTMEETETESELMTEYPDDGFGDFGDFGDYGDYGETYTAEELREAIEQQERDIEECKLQIRESELRLKQYDRTLENKIVKSTMNGVVTSAGTVEDAVADDSFIVIAGASGMYVRGTVSETKLDTVKVGDQVQGISYDTGLSFTATITEISQYPSDNEDGYYYGENANASNYPFLAYIEDAEGMQEGWVELQIVDNTPTTGIYLENYFVRSESGGKSYVYLQGSDGLLKKQYVKTGKSLYGMAVEIREGITLEDKIAFPYGDDVAEGAETREVDSLESAYGYYGVG